MISAKSNVKLNQATHEFYLVVMLQFPSEYSTIPRHLYRLHADGSWSATSLKSGTVVSGC